MDWSKGFSASYYAMIVDKKSWRDSERFEIIEGSVTRADTSLIESADITTTYAMSKETWIRVYLDVRQEGDSAHVPLFTGLALPPATDIDGEFKSYKLECYSVLKPAEDVLLQRGYYVPAGQSGGDAVSALLDVCDAPVVIDGTAPTLRDTLIAESGENHLSMAQKVLKAINWRLRIDGDGTIHVAPKAKKASVVFSADDNDSVEPKVTLTHDWFGCPNVFRAISDDWTAIATDERDDSFLSIQNRGREVWKEETSCKLNDNEDLAEYATRRLKEEQSKGYEVSYSRRFHPDITVSDYVGLRYPAQGLGAEYRVSSQKLSLTHGCRTEEKVDFYVNDPMGITVTVIKPRTE